MNINKKAIDEALVFYDIYDLGYKHKCYDVIDEINQNEVFIKMVDDIMKNK